MIQRCWVPNNVIFDTNDFLEVWDGGSKRYERWPDGTECCWEVIKVRADTAHTDMSFTEILRELPSWDTPAKSMWTERIPVLSSEGRYQIPGWSITYSIVPDASQAPVSQGPPLNAPKHSVNRRHFHHKKAAHRLRL